MSELLQGELFVDVARGRKRVTAHDRRNSSMFLRNQFRGTGKYGIPIVRKQTVNLDYVNLIACMNTIPNEEEYFDCGVHFFVDDYDFGAVYEHPEKTYPI